MPVMKRTFPLLFEWEAVERPKRWTMLNASLKLVSLAMDAHKLWASEESHIVKTLKSVQKQPCRGLKWQVRDPLVTNWEHSKHSKHSKSGKERFDPRKIIGRPSFFLAIVLNLSISSCEFVFWIFKIFALIVLEPRVCVNDCWSQRKEDWPRTSWEIAED